ncbi:MAG: lytic murein transglycosylase [Solirubrobacterales bacterium]
MKGKRAALVVSLALLAAALVVGSLPAMAEVVKGPRTIVGQGTAGIDVDLPDGMNIPTTTTPGSITVCSDGLDNDGDGKADFKVNGVRSDLGCESAADTDEADGPDGAKTTEDTSATDEDLDEDEGGSQEVGEDKKTKRKKKSKSEAEDEASGEAGERTGGKRTKSKSQPADRNAPRRRDGAPTKANPSVSITSPGPAPIGVPNFMIDRFRIPPFLLSIYQAAGIQYGIRWEVLAAINEIETDYGRNLNVSYAGAQGWMQFMPATWKAYGVDANEDGQKDPYNPVDAIFAAARYLRAAGGHKDLRKAIFAYNHADWYVDSVLLRARVIGRLPGDFVGSLTGLTQGRFPVAAKAKYANEIDAKDAKRRAKPRSRGKAGNRADIVDANEGRSDIAIFARRGAPVVAVNDGVILKAGTSSKLGRYVKLRDVYGNVYTYSGLGRLAKAYAVPKERKLSADDFKLVKPRKDDAPDGPASGKSAKGQIGGAKGTTVSSGRASRTAARVARRAASSAEADTGANSEDSRDRLFAYPERPRNAEMAEVTGQLDALLAAKLPGYATFSAYFTKAFKFDRTTMDLKRLRKGAKVPAGTVLGRIGKTSDDKAPHMTFAVKPTGDDAPEIDPKPILDGWKLLESTAIYRAAGENPFIGDEKNASIGQILLMSKSSLQQRVLADPNISMYACGRDDVKSGRMDRRALANMAYLGARGYRLGITSMRCGRDNSITTSGNVSNHSFGGAFDIATINGRSVLGNQKRGSAVEALVKDVMKLQGNLRPDELISLYDFGGPSFAMADHADHVHVGYRPAFRTGKGKQVAQILKPKQWKRLIGRLYEIDNPTVRKKPSRAAIPAKKRSRR